MPTSTITTTILDRIIDLADDGTIVIQEVNTNGALVLDPATVAALRQFLERPEVRQALDETP